jgi:DinB superfamily
MEKQELLAALNDTAAQIESFATPLNEERLNTVPYLDSWTAAQLLRHLVKSTGLVTGGLETPGKPADRDPGARIGELRRVFLDTTHKLQSPDVIAPESIHYQKTDILTQWHNAFESFNIAAEKADPASLVEDLPFGPATKIELLNFVDVHLQRHLIQMKKITTALN